MGLKPPMEFICSPIPSSHSIMRAHIFLIANVLDGNVEAANQKLDQIAQRIQQPLPPRKNKHPAIRNQIQSHARKIRGDGERWQGTHRGGRHFPGGAFAALHRVMNVEPFEVYTGASPNPSPYMFFFDFGPVDDEPLFIVGSSPEMFVRLEGGTASLRPLPGRALEEPTPTLTRISSRNCLLIRRNAPSM